MNVEEQKGCMYIYISKSKTIIPKGPHLHQLPFELCSLRRLLLLRLPENHAPRVAAFWYDAIRVTNKKASRLNKEQKMEISV